jgi:hypothetical protein
MNICGNGFIHGAFDEIGHRKADYSVYRDLVDVCNDVPQSVRQSGCVDGYGHSVWLRTYDLVGALTLCRFFTDSDSQSVCLSGIIMQMYRDDPFTGEPPVMSIDKADLVCDVVREQTGSEDLVRRCYYEAAWPLGLEAGTAAEAMLAGRPAGDIAWMPPQHLMDKTKNMYGEAFGKCDSYPNWVDVCREKIVQAPIWRVSGDAAINAEICKVFPPKYAELCTSRTRVIVAPLEERE